VWSLNRFVLGQAEPADWCLGFYTAVRPMPVLSVQPDRELLSAAVECGRGFGVGAHSLSALEDENTRLKRLQADAMLDNAALKDPWERNGDARGRAAVAHLRVGFGMSERRACKAIGCCRMTMRYKTTRADDAGLR